MTQGIGRPGTNSTGRPEEQPLLDVHNLSVDYVTQGRATAHALVDITFQLRRGEVMGLVGESGCGKSTLALALIRLLPAAGRITQGAIRLQGTDLLALSEREMADYRWRRIAMVFQGAMNALNPVRTVGRSDCRGHSPARHAAK